MQRLIGYPSIEQYRTIVKNLNFDVEKANIKRPVIKVKCTEKLNGTNGGVCFSTAAGFWVQSKNNIITPNKDNAGCASYNVQITKEWVDIINQLATEYNIDLDKNIITVYFEWCGAGIQSKTAVSGIKEKLAMIFDYFRVSPLEDTETDQSQWFLTKANNVWVSNKEVNIYNINDFPVYEIEIDFSQPLLSQNKLVDLVENTIEVNSPVGKQFGFENNIGEGVVAAFTFNNNFYQFKVKGEKHAQSPVKKLQKVDDEKVQKIVDIVNRVTPGWRLEQMFNEANNILNGGVPSMSNMGNYIKLVNNDIIKEESDIIAEAGLQPKDIFGTVSIVSREYYKKALDDIIMQSN